MHDSGGLRRAPNLAPQHTQRYGRSMGAPASDVALRRGVLAVSVLDDIDLVPVDGGVRLDLGAGAGASAGYDEGGRARPADPDVEGEACLAWEELADAVGSADPESEVGRYRLRDWLRMRLLFAQLGSAAAWRAELAAVPVGLPSDHALHPGPEWVRDQVLGGAIDLGIGIRGLVGDDPDHVALLPARLSAEIRLDTSLWWPALRARLEEMGDLTVARLRRDASDLITPMGGCDVVTLLGASSLRTFLAQSDGTGMRGLAVPMRSRGWFDLARIDPAFVSAAAAATDEVDRAFWRPLLVTRDGVNVASAGGDVRTIVLRDPAAAEPSWGG